MLNVIIGPPGTGKTHYLIEKVKNILSTTSTQPEEIGYFSFTRRATREAVRRAREALELPRSRFPYFSTLHSMAFNQLGLTRDRVCGRKEMGAFAKSLGLNITKATSDDAYTSDETWPDKTDDDQALHLINLLRITQRTLDQIPWTPNLLADVERVKLLETEYTNYKDRLSLVDYTDMLELVAMHSKLPSTLEAIIIDEAQDLSKLQWVVIGSLIRANPNASVYIAGDDDQSIYEWAGADLDEFSRMVGTDEVNVIILNQSHRVPAEIFEVAERVIGRCEKRIPKNWQPTKEQGKVLFASDVELVEWNKPVSTLYLTRNEYLLRETIEFLQGAGIPWSYLHDKQDTLIRLSTIHGAKGAQADRVVLNLQMAKASYNDGIITDAEARVWYVAVTRAKHELILVDSKNKTSGWLYIAPPL